MSEEDILNYRTEQEKFWAGEFGDQYTERNTSEAAVAADTALFARILSRTRGVRSIIEFGANIGINLRAIRRLLPDAALSAIEINHKAVAELEKLGEITVYLQSILDYVPDEDRDLVLIKGVLIHINPDELGSVYEKLYRTSGRYIVVAEYYNPVPVEVNYRGHSGKLFKRDFAGEMLERFGDLHLVDYGFVYRRDLNFRQDDITWFLLEKRNSASVAK